MKHVVATLGVVMLIASSASACAWGEDAATVSGVVRDARGTPQLGALVELLGPDASVLARAFTDEHGRYLLSAELQGTYRLRASAAFLVPAVRSNLRLRAGGRAVADLTMSSIFEAGSWLPVEDRKPGESAEDWRWTLRSTANRPMLRLVDDSDSNATDGVSSSEARPRRPISEGQLALLAGDGSFGQGGAHQVLTLDRAGLDGDASVLRASIGDVTSAGSGASVAVAAGVERKRAFGGETRIFLSFSSDPELQAGTASGLAVLRTSSSERIALGDMIAVDAGTLFTAERLLGSRFESAPYVRIAFHPSPEMVVEYRLATDRNLQRSEDVGQVPLPEQALVDSEGRPIVRRGLHQEIAATENHDKTTVTLAVYRDSVPVEGVEGGGNVPLQELSGLPILADPSTGKFLVTLPGLSGGTSGARIAWTEVISPFLSACVQGVLGTALTENGADVKVANLSSSVRAHASAALSAAVDLKTSRSGTYLDVRYRWQPERDLTQVGEFDAVPGEAYLGARLQQRLWGGRRLKGVNAVVEATNLLAQGYEPLLGPDGETLFLAPVPRGLQGGLSFSF